MAEITEVRSGHWSNSPCLELLTTSEVIRVGPHPAARASSPALASAGATRWEPRLHALLTSLLADGARA